MSCLVNPEFVKVEQDVDLKMEHEEATHPPEEPNFQIHNYLEPEGNSQEIEDFEEVDEPNFKHGKSRNEIFCPVCSTFTTLAQFEVHLYSEHTQGLEISKNDQDVSPPVTYSCQLGCPFVSSLKTKLVIHYFGHINRRSKNSLKPILSYLNTAGFSTNSRNSRPKCKPKVVPKSNKKPSFPCKEPGCPEKFNRFVDLKMHIVNGHQLNGPPLVATDPVPYWSCELCGFVALGKKWIELHLKSKHQGEAGAINSVPLMHGTFKKPTAGRPKNPSKEIKIRGRRPGGIQCEGNNQYYFSLAKDPNFTDFYQCTRGGCDKRFPKLSQIRTHVLVDHKESFFKTDQLKYKGIQRKCNQRGLYRCNLCGWMGALYPRGHLLFAHPNEYSKISTERGTTTGTLIRGKSKKPPSLTGVKRKVGRPSKNQNVVNQ